MKVEIRKGGYTVYIVEAKTDKAICVLPSILNREDIPQTLKAISIFLKELGHEIRKHKRGEAKKN